MGRLTLNVLLSFAQFERELASERVKDKVAASRKKGKWTGGTVPLGYDAKDKKLVVNNAEAETVRTIFRSYLERKSFSRLVADLDKRGIVTKRRSTKVQKYHVGIPFTYGPLAYFLKNRIYLGEMHHGGKWFKGEHAAIIDRTTFEQVQELLKSNTVKRKVKFSRSGALLQGKLFDDKGNRMGPTFSSKKGVRYRFYFNTALRGRKHKAGSVTRVAAQEIEEIVSDAIRKKFDIPDAEGKDISDRIERVVLGESLIRISLADGELTGRSKPATIEVPWTRTKAGQIHPPSTREGERDQKLVQAVVRAHVWLSDLKSGRFSSVEELAISYRLRPKVVRQGLGLAFLAPKITTEILTAEAPATLRLGNIPKRLSLPWTNHRPLLPS
jgi:site-specific DNA recombinase